MKKTITLLLLVLFIQLNAQNTYVPDDNFEQALIDLGYDSGPLDDYVPTANINTVTNLNVYNKNIDELTGIEDFVALTNLSCGVNNLSNLNISANINLVYLYCNSNDLTGLDVTANTNLVFIYCNSNNISSLDVSANTNLIQLDCSFNNLTMLNIKNGNNTALSNSNFHATNNPNLTCILVDDATWSSANWTNIDAQTTFNDVHCSPTGMTYVPDNNFEQALINLGYDTGTPDDYVPTANIDTVTMLDVNSKNISDLTGIEDFVALTSLKCYVNNLNDLDVSANIALTVLNCRSNNLSSLDVSANTALTQLDCRLNNLTSLDLSSNTDLIHLYCLTNNLISLDVSANTALTRLFCGSNNISTLDVSANTALVDLGCPNNNLTSLNVKNGNNSNFIYFGANNNPNLTCIIVDDAIYSTTNWTNIDATSTFVNSQAECNALSIDDANFDDAISIYPNPTKNSFTITNNGNFVINKITIYDVLSKVVYQANAVGNNIDTSNFKTGLYLVKIDSNSNSITKKLIVSK